MTRGPCRILSDDAPDASIAFSFDGRPYFARPGDTLAAALLANGVQLVGRSFKYHRPRGIMTAGVEEPNALVTVGERARRTPNTRATDVFVYEGLVARSQNAWPSVQFDIGAALGLLGNVFAAGFYYKTFFGSPKRWLMYEKLIRRAAGLGMPPLHADADRYDARSVFCDTLVVGGGPAGLAAAHVAAARGERVILVEQDRVLGGSLLRDAQPLPDLEALANNISAHGGHILTRTTAVALWDHRAVTLVQLCAEPGACPPDSGVAQRIWHVRAKAIVLATGAIERPLTFAGNDRPGVMLSGAVRRYIAHYRVLPGQQVVIATNNDDGYRTADAVLAAGGRVVAMLDSREAAPPSAPYPVYVHASVHDVHGSGRGVRRVVARVGDRDIRLEADLLAVSGGFTPTLHLLNQGEASLRWRDDIQAFVPDALPDDLSVVGAAHGDVPPIAPPPRAVPHPKSAFVDFQNDVTVSDIALAWREGYRSVEHLKRYTTLGMATDQGKTSNMAALARLAASGETTVPHAGQTRFRPPYVPLTLGALAGADAGGHIAPERHMALHDVHAARDPIWLPLGYWVRPRAYPLGKETLRDAALREARAVRTAAGIADVSTLAKFAIKGPDAACLLEHVCATAVGKLRAGRGRYTFMLREDGMVFDDGTVWCLGAGDYLLTSSTGGAERMESHLRYVHQVLAPALRVSVVPLQEQFVGIALAGPRAGTILADLSAAPPPAHMGVATGMIAGVTVTILAASYSGERAFEIYADAPQGAPVWHALDAAVHAAGGAPYGLEAMEFLRIEKGHVLVGGEIDGRTTADDLGLSKMLNPQRSFVGASALQRPALNDPNRLQLVGLQSTQGPIAEGAMVMTAAGQPVIGHVTSAGERVVSGGAIALALVAGGRARLGESLLASSPTRGITAPVIVTAPHFYDEAGARYRD